MNEAQQLEFHRLRAEQQELQARLADLGARLGRFESAVASAGLPTPPPANAPLFAAPATMPPPAAPEVPPPLPHVPPVPPPVASPAFDSAPPIPPPIPPREPAFAGGPPPIPAAPRESLEVRIGTTWLVRVGVVLLLAGLAFVGSYLYKNVIPYLGPVAKVGLLYLGAGILTGLGFWLERSRDAARSTGLLNYARVVLAGGLAAVYYVTYAAHWNPQLLVLHNPLLAGGLLLGWTAFMVWLADRRKSEILATFAILLAYYTSAINEIEGFTLFSNLSLTVAAVYLLRRHLWRVFPFASLLATFGSYAFWNYYHAFLPAGLEGVAPHHVARGADGFWIESVFLLIYWLLFTGSVFAPGERIWSAGRRASFVSLNNGAFFLLTTWLLLGEYPGSFWKWSLLFGGVLCGLAEACRRLPQRLDSETESAYLLQGLLLVTLGFVTYFTGWQLSVVLAVQSAVIVGVALQRQGRLLLGAAAATGLLSFLYAANQLETLGRSAPWLSGAGVGVLLVFNAWWSQRWLERHPVPPPDGVPPLPSAFPAFRELVPVAPWYFSLFGLLIGWWLIDRKLDGAVAHVPVLAVAALLLTASVYGLRVRAIPFYAQVYLLAAHFHWIASEGFRGRFIDNAGTWNALLLLGITLALGHWWNQRWPQVDDRLLPTRQPNRPFAIGSAVFVVILLFAWLQPGGSEHRDLWVAGSAALSVGILLYGLFTRYRALALAGQALLVISLFNCALLWRHGWDSAYRREMWPTLAPLAAILATLAIARRGLANDARGKLLALPMVVIYELTAALFLVAWGVQYIPDVQQFTFFALTGALLSVWASVRGEHRWRIWSGLLTAIGLLAFALLEKAERGSFIHVAGIACLVGQQQFERFWKRRNPSADALPSRAQAVLMTFATLCAWALLNARMAHWSDGAFTLAAAWSIFAALVFVAGLTLREKVYRWLGLLILVCTLGRVAVVDIWQLDSLGRAISAMCLGSVLLGIGFLYNKFHAKWHGLF